MVSISEDGKVYVNDSAVEIDVLVPRLSAAYGACQDWRGVILRADKRIEYGVVVQVMGAIREAGIDQIGMVTEPFAGDRGVPRE